jgi:hypothetical protein
MKKSIAFALLGTAITLGACERTPVNPAGESPAAQATAAAPELSPEMTQQLAAVRLASRKYNDVNVALGEGYVPISPCVEVPGLGGMGVHFGKLPTMGDAEYVATEPEILLYAPQADGSMKLIGVEYWITQEAWEAAGKSGRPMFVEQPFDFDPANDHGLPARYTLHVWNWLANPSGIFAPFNPRVSCPPAEHVGHSAHNH